VVRLPLATLIVELENTTPCTLNADPFGCATLRPGSPATFPSVRIALPGRLHWLSDGHWMRTFAGSAAHVTVADWVLVKPVSGRLSAPLLKQDWPAAPLNAWVRMSLTAAWAAPSASYVTAARSRSPTVVRRLVSTSDSNAPSTTAITVTRMRTKTIDEPVSSAIAGRPAFSLMPASAGR
jgi:hypothetical protein